jgi:hypothetical protein
MNTLAGLAAVAAWRLRGARACAWALLLSGWLTLGELGAAAWPQTAGGVLPLVLWLLAVGAGLGLARRHPPGAAGLRAGLLAAAGFAWVLMMDLPSGSLVLALLALAWAMLLVLASLTARALRHGVIDGAGCLSTGLPAAGMSSAGTSTGTPIGPACVGATLAWAAHTAAGASWLTGPALAVAPTQAQAPTALLLVLCALLLAALVPARVLPPGACRAGLFDCSLPLVGHAYRAWRWPAPRRWPALAASLVMLPMMASLPAMAPWCAGAVGGGDVLLSVGAALAGEVFAGPALLTGLHLAAMLLPGALLAAWWRLWPGWVPGERRLVTAIALLMLAGLCLWVVWPAGAAGLLLLGLCHGAAWSLAWAGAMLRRRVPGVSAAPAAPVGAGFDTAAASPARWAQPLLAAVGLMPAPTLVLGLGWAIAQWGAAALVGVHVALALWALAGWWLTIALDLVRADAAGPAASPQVLGATPAGERLPAARSSPGRAPSSLASIRPGARPAPGQ